jgi:hypothetical protein
LKHVLEEAGKDSSIIEVYLHVQTSNDDAKSFYIRNGFEQVDMMLNYYRNIDPPHSFLLKKSLKEGYIVSSGVIGTAHQEESPEQKEEIRNELVSLEAKAI